MRPIRFDSRTTSGSAWLPADLSRTGGFRCARCTALPAPVTDLRRDGSYPQGVLCGPPHGGPLMRRIIFAVACFVSLQILAFAQGERPLLFRHPTVSQTQIVFSFAGDLW